LQVARDVDTASQTHHPIPPNVKRLCSVANIKSQIKRNRQNDEARERNKSVKSALKTSIRRFREAAEAGDADVARTLGHDASRNLDKAVSAGVIHKNQAANKKSSIAKRSATL
jgi:small subunit ribosomal protein S20